MKKVLEKFKNLYKGEERLKRHGMILLLLLIPAIAGSMRYIVDKDTPKEILIPALCVMAVLLLLSIVPYFFLNGFYADFYRSRIKSKVGLPKINGETFIHGLKLFPIQFVWGLYALIPTLILMGIPIVILVSSVTTESSGDKLLGFILFIIFFIIFYIGLIAAFLILAPFFNYIQLSFIEDFVYRPEYFNPMTLVYYMKRVFKDTMITMLKFLLASIIISTVVQTISVLITLFVGIFAGFAAIATSGDGESVITPVSVMILVPVCTLLVLAQTYTTVMISCAASDAYTDIYKEQIRLPDPAEKQEIQENELNQE